jgi:hypothetical protein
LLAHKLISNPDFAGGLNPVENLAVQRLGFAISGVRAALESVNWAVEVWPKWEAKDKAEEETPDAETT